MKTKKKLVLLFTVIMTLLMSMTAFGGTWRNGVQPNQNRWWYDNGDGTYAQNGWQWIDGNQDGSAESYYFDGSGWLATSTTVDGYQVNENGAWTQNGVVQTKALAVQNVTGQGTGSLIVYFSKSGTTRRAAQQIQSLTGGETFELQAADAYPSDYNSTLIRAEREQNSNARPALASSVPNLSSYDTVYVGYPIWYGDAPMLIYTFLENNDFTGKTIIPFCTSGSSGIESSVRYIRSSCPGATVLQGLRANDTSAIEPWLRQIGK